MRDMKKVLMLTYHFPPTINGGVFRTVKFAKYLSRFGWEPVILTSRKKTQDFAGETLLTEISGIRIIRTYAVEIGKPRVKRPKKVDIYSYSPGNRITSFKKTLLDILRAIRKFCLIPDDKVGWLPFALIQALRTIRREKIILVYTASPPHTGQLVGYLIKKITGLPWVADFRDPWTQNMDSLTEKRGWRNRLAEFMERSVLTTADKIINTTEPMRHNFLNKYPMLDKDKFVVITNGFDEDDFANIKSRQTADKFVITHTGMLYGERSACSFLQALAELIDAGSPVVGELSADFIGNVGRETLRSISELKLENIVKVLGCVPYEQSLQYLANSSILLLITHPGRIGQVQTPAKLFEYLRIGKPILALTPPGTSADLITTLRAGVTVHPHDVMGIKREITKMLLAYQKGQLHSTTDQSMLSKFKRSELTRSLCKIFDDIVGN